MLMPTSAGDLINGSLRLIGMLAEGETPSSETANDALVALNQMLESWSTERLAVYATQDQVFSWPPNQATRTIGPTGDFVGERPIMIDDSTYFRDASTGVSYNLSFINQLQYNSIAVKTVQSTYPQLMWVNETHPDLTMTVFPVPNRVLEFHIVSVQPLAQPALLSTYLSFPPGYLRCFRYNLACELAPEFGVEPSPTVQRIAVVSKRDLKRINNPGDLMMMPYGIISRRNRFNIYTGAPT
jgi:hypothetical protein